MLSSIVLILGSLLFIGAGIFCILQPEISLLIVGWYIGFVLVLGGALQIIRFFQIDPGYRSFWHLLIALLDVVFGIWMLVSMVFTLVAYMLPLMFAIYILLRGILMIVLRKKKEKEMNALHRFVLPILALCGSVFMVIAAIYAHGISISTKLLEMPIFYYLIVFVVVMAIGAFFSKPKNGVESADINKK